MHPIEKVLKCSDITLHALPQQFSSRNMHYVTRLCTLSLDYGQRLRLQVIQVSGVGIQLDLSVCSLGPPIRLPTEHF